MISEQKNAEGSEEIVEEEASLVDGEKAVVTKADTAEAPSDEGSAPEDIITLLEEQIEALQVSVAENLDKAIRAQAELDNVRKRSRRDVEKAHKYALEGVIRELLPVLDSLELGIKNSDMNVDDMGSLHEGMKMTMKMFVSSLEKFGARQIAPQSGEKFNPEQHEAITIDEADGIGSGEIITMQQKGYELNGRLVRPAMVIVAK